MTTEIQAAFDHQYTKDMLRMLVKRVMALTRRYERNTTSKSTDTAEDRIHSALAKLFAGERTWDPSRVDLDGFLLGVIASDLSSELRRRNHSPLVPPADLARPREDGYTGAPRDDDRADIGAPIEYGRPAPFAPDAADDAWSLAIDHLCERAAADTSVLALLGAWSEGIHDRRDVLHHLGWSASKYLRVYHRLVALAQALDPEVCEHIRYALAN